eukprot:g1446.t1
MGADMCASEREKPETDTPTIKQHRVEHGLKEMIDDLSKQRMKQLGVRTKAGVEGSAASSSARTGKRSSRLPPIVEVDASDPPWVRATRETLSIQFNRGTELMQPTPTAEALSCFQNVVAGVDEALMEHQRSTPTAVFRELSTKKCRALGNMGLYYDKKMQFADAADCYKRCYDAAVAVECDLCLVGNIANNVAAATFNDGNAKEALKWFELSSQHWSMVAEGNEHTAGSLAALSRLTETEVAKRRNKAKTKKQAIARQIKTMRDIVKIEAISASGKE